MVPNVFLETRRVGLPLPSTAVSLHRCPPTPLSNLRPCPPAVQPRVEQEAEWWVMRREGKGEVDMTRSDPDLSPRSQTLSILTKTRLHMYPELPRLGTFLESKHTLSVPVVTIPQKGYNK